MAAKAGPGRPRTAAETVRALGALLLIAALLLGIPAGLLSVAGPPPLPSTIPGLDDLVAAITQPDDGALLVAALTWVGWLGWVTLAVSIAVEIPAAARGVRAPRLPVLGPQQRLAAVLVAAAALLFTAGPASLAASQPAHADTAATATADTLPIGTSAQAEETPPGVHLVERGDTLWDIAGTHLGSGHRYPELYEASKDTVQPDGRRLTDPNLIRPGWEITIPPHVEPADLDGGPSVGDTAASRVAPNDGEPPATPTPTPVDGAHQDSTPANLGPTFGARTADEPDLSGPPSVRPAETAIADGAETEPPGQDDGAVNGCTVGGIGAILAGGLLFYLGAQRAVQHRHRKPGQRIALPTGAAPQLEAELRSVHDPLSMDQVNRALRTLAARCAVTGMELPAVRLARLIGAQLELHLAVAADVPAPFTPTVSPTLWALDPGGDILDAGQADDYPAPYPSLVTVGHDADGGLILINLEHIGALNIDSDDTDTAEMLGGIAAELATSLWSDDVRVTTVGAAPDLTHVLDSGRIRYLDGTDPQQLDHLLDEVTARADADRAALHDVGVPSLAAARPAGVAEGIWAPEILLIGTPMTSAQHDRLAELVHAEPRVAMAAVTTAVTPLTEWTVRLHPSEADHAIVEPVGLGIRPQRLGPQDYAGLVDLLAAARAEPSTAAPSWRVNAAGESGLADLPAEPKRPEPGTQPAATTEGGAARRPPAGDAEEPSVAVAAPAESDGAPLVAVLGPVEIHHAPELAEPSKRGQLTALAAYLTLNPGQTRDAVDEAMWPGRRVSLATRNTAMTKLRNWLGVDPDGTDYVPRATGDGYRLYPAVRTDWHQFTELLPDGPAEAPTDTLIAALNLVRDQPFKGVNPRRYIWAERIQQEMIAAIGDVADELARRALRAGDHRLALRAIMTGLAAEPGSEVLWRHRLRAHHAANDREALDQAADQLTAMADDLGGDLEDETTELLTQLLSPVRTGQPATTTRRIA